MYESCQKHKNENEKGAGVTLAVGVNSGFKLKEPVKFTAVRFSNCIRNLDFTALC